MSNLSFNFLLITLAIFTVLSAASEVATTYTSHRTDDSVDHNSRFMEAVAAATRSYCTCGAAILQSRLCHQDFAILGEVDAWRSKPFYALRETHSSPGWPFSGATFPTKVVHAIKGPLKVNQSTDLYYILGTNCGITDRMLPRSRGKYLISGFKVTVPGCQSLGVYCHFPSEVFVVTRCGWSEPVEDVSLTQITGLFLGLYKCDLEACLMQPLFTKPQMPKPPTACYYDHKATRCYSKFAVCIRAPHPRKPGSFVCQTRAVTRLPALQEVLEIVPPEFHTTIFRAQVLSINDEVRFNTCIFFDKFIVH